MKNTDKIINDTNQLIYEALRQNEMSRVGNDFNGHKVLVLAGDHNAHYLFNNELIGKFKIPSNMPKTLNDLKWDYKHTKLDAHINDLLVWFKSKAIVKNNKKLNITNFELLEITYDQMSN